ncbi:hypothetical protein E2C01_029592 [Portunus trituberculatus]|uniref:Uncharacterized protein n=1 Tax=Portunus trituberculatus TaxID=210409 RepID=A0A5B7EPR4_PORTR|nr:hypothetical protein [Portunus trituberculatus]
MDAVVDKYVLGSEELRVLEQEMQRLFMLGYRWSHTYTQCVLQTLLRSFRDGVEFDISTCNGDLDQDLEGALKAIEGEELPSEATQHYNTTGTPSPVNTNPSIPQESSGKDHEGIGDQGLSSHPQDSPPTSQNGQTNSIHSSVSKLLQVQPSTLDDGHGTTHDDNNMANNYIQSYLVNTRTPHLCTDGDSDHTNEVYPQHYQPYSKRGYMDTRGQDLDLSNYTPRLSSKNIFLTYDSYQASVLTITTSTNRDRDSSSSGNRYRDDDRQPFDEQFMRDEEEEDSRDEVFGEEPTRPMYRSDYGDLAALGPWSFQREERQDVKKPGPFHNSKNNYAFRNYDQRLYQDMYRQPEIPSFMIPRKHQWQSFLPIRGLWSAGGMFRGLQSPRAFYSMQPTLPQEPGIKDVPVAILSTIKILAIFINI